MDCGCLSHRCRPAGPRSPAERLYRGSRYLVTWRVRRVQAAPVEILNPVGTIGTAVSESSAWTRGLRAARRLGYRAYFRATAYNYERRLLARPNRTPAGVVWTYDLLNRHGRDGMLAALADHVGFGDVCYDVGANVGIYAVALATRGPRVVAFEPSPPAVERLRATVARNRLAGRVAVHACGLGDETATRPFFVSTYPELSGFDRESATRWGGTVHRRTTAPVRQLDELATPPPDLLKLDVEGAGPAVLRGGRETLATHRPTLFVETHETGLPGDPAGEMRVLLDDLGYTVDDRDGFWVCHGR